MRSVKTILVHLALIVGSTLLTVGVLEGVVRIVWPQKLIVLRPDLWIPDDEVGWRNAPNLDTKVNTGERDVRLLTDARGHRVPARPGEEARHTILAVGDSFLAALQVEYEQTMTALLEVGLSEELGETVRIVNAGVDRWNLNHYLLETRSELAREAYDLVLVFIYVNNDVGSRQAVEARASILHRFRAPRRFTRLELVDALLRPFNDLMERRSHLYVLVKNRLKYLRMRLGLSAYYMPWPCLVAQADSPHWTATADLGAEIHEAGAAHRIPVLFVLMPGLLQIDQAEVERYASSFNIDPAEIDVGQPKRLLTTLFEARGLAVVNPTDALSAAHASGVTDLYGYIDTHLGVNGHRTVAAFLKPLLVEALRQEPSSPFSP